MRGWITNEAYINEERRTAMKTKTNVKAGGGVQS